MGSSGFCSPRSDCFPAGLRVLVVDDDPTWLKILAKMLKKCNYEVTTCNLAQEALDLLRERKDGFDIIISDVNMPDMDGFKLLEHVGLKMDLPVIMMSVDGETSRVMKGVQHGACDYLLKPIRMKELQNIWQHVFRKRIQEVRGIEGQSSLDETRMMRNGTEQSDDGHLFSGDMISGKKRKDVDNKNNNRECGDPSSVKKARVVWTVDLHQKFVKAVNQIGFDKVGPKKILDLMGEPRLTRENVASHLQKYRLYLSRLQKENELKAACGGIKLSDISSKDPSGNVCHQSAAESKKPLFGDMTNCPISSTSRIAHHTWRTGVPSVQFKQEFKPHFQSEHRYDHFPLPMPRIQVDFLSHNSRPLSREANKPTEATSYSKNRSYAIGTENTAALLSVQPQSHLTSCHTFEPISCSMWSTKNHNLEQNLHDNLESSLENLVVGTGADLGYFSPGDLYPPNPHLVNLESFSYSNQKLIADVRPHLYDSENFDCEYPSDPVEYLVMDQGLYIA